MIENTKTVKRNSVENKNADIEIGNIFIYLQG